MMNQESEDTIVDFEGDRKVWEDRIAHFDVKPRNSEPSYPNFLEPT